MVFKDDSGPSDQMILSLIILTTSRFTFNKRSQIDFGPNYDQDFQESKTTVVRWTEV